VPTASRTSRRCQRLVVHIGDHKTGSTSIQYAFAKGQILLDDTPVCYPTDLNHTYLRKHLPPQAQPVDPQTSQKVIHRLARKIRESGASASLISAEALESANPVALREMLDTYFSETAQEIRVVAYVRPHAPRFLSSFTELTKIGVFSGNLDAYLSHLESKRRKLYHPRFSAWQAAFGDRFILRPMIRDMLLSNSVLHDFVHHAFGPEARITGAAAPSNESLCLEDLMRLKVLQARMGQQPQKLRHALGWEFSRLLATLPAPETRTRLHLHQSLATRLKEVYLEDARALDRDFFDNKPLMTQALETACTDAPESAQNTDPEAWFSPTELRSLTIYADLVAGLLDSGDVNWARVLRQRRVAALMADEPSAAPAGEPPRKNASDPQP